MTIKAVIFDLDGVIVDTAGHHYLAWKRLAEELGLSCPPERKDQVRGISRAEALKIVLAERWEEHEGKAQELMARKDAYYQELIRGIGPDDLLPGVQELLDDLKNHGMKVAVATVSRNAKLVLSRLGILGEFDVVVDGHSGARSKPAPDLFFYAAERLGIPPSECLVVEDAPAGIVAAELAGMGRVALGREDLFEDVRSDLVLPSLEGITYERLLVLLEEAQRKRSAWLIEQHGFAPPSQGTFETIFTVGNGYLGTRGSLEESYPGDHPATLIAGLYDNAPLFFTELATAPDWTVFELFIEGERFSLLQGETLLHERSLDLRDGVLRRRVRWRDPQGRTVEIQTLRFASLAEPHLCVQVCAVTALDFAGEVELRTWLPEEPENPGLPPFPEVGLSHWRTLSRGTPDEGIAYLALRTRRSGTELAVALGLSLSGVPEGEFRPLEGPSPGVSVRVRLPRGGTAVAVKFVSFTTSLEADDPLPLSLEVLKRAKAKGPAWVLGEHRRAWKRLWRDCDVVIEGDEGLQRAVRFNLYHLLIAAPRHAEGESIPAKGLTGFGYRGHIFWDTEIFMLPFFTFTQPEVARRLLMYRHRTLPGARENARRRGYRGAMYPWESAAEGREVTPRWFPDEEGNPIPILCGELEHHITADVAYAVWQYWRASGDEDFLRDYGAEIVLETARFWASRVEYDERDGCYHIRHVIGPDEYHEDVDDNAFTNWMARWNLRAGIEVWEWLKGMFPARAERLFAKLGLNEGEVRSWKEIAEKTFLPWGKDALIEQFKGYFALENVDLRSLEPRTRPVGDLLGPERTKGSQVIKQPDVLMLLHLLREEFDEDTLRANWEYYEPRTDHSFGSSLGPAIHTALAARLGRTGEACEHLQRAAFVDLEDTRGNTRDGIHMASAGGLWQALVFGFAGLELTPEGPKVAPRLPPHWRRLQFSICYRGQRFPFDIKGQDLGDSKQ